MTTSETQTFQHTIISKIVSAMAFSLLPWAIYVVDGSRWIGLVALALTILFLLVAIYGGTTISIHDGVLKKQKYFNVKTRSVNLKSLTNIQLLLAFVDRSGATYYSLRLTDKDKNQVSFMLSFYVRSWSKQDELIKIIDKYGQQSEAVYNKTADKKIRQSQLAWDSKYQVTASFEKKLVVTLVLILPVMFIIGMLVIYLQR